MFCNSCGKELQAGQQFCSVCGQPVGVARVPSAAHRVVENIKLLGIPRGRDSTSSPGQCLSWRKTILGLPETGPLAHGSRLAILLWLLRNSPPIESPVRVGRFFDLE